MWNPDAVHSRERSPRRPLNTEPAASRYPMTRITTSSPGPILTPPHLRWTLNKLKSPHAIRLMTWTKDCPATRMQDRRRVLSESYGMCSTLSMSMCQCQMELQQWSNGVGLWLVCRSMLPPNRARAPSLLETHPTVEGMIRQRREKRKKTLCTDACPSFYLGR